VTYGDILVPEWCDYPEPTAGEMGCWSLVDGLVKSKSYCKDCDCFKQLPNNPEHEKAIINNQKMVALAIKEPANA
jgi:hypothetical protein